MRYKESETVELKKSTSELKEAVISIAAMLNKHGKGTVYFGIKDDGTAIGQQAGKETLRDVAQAIAERIEPKIFPRIKTTSIQGKTCVKVEFEGAQSPYFAYGRAYTRGGRHRPADIGAGA
jgi:ATP-dependent DNA helicase RecG